MRYRMLFMPVLAVVCSLSSARADEFASPEGFTITVPDGWKTASQEQLDKAAEAAKKAAGSAQAIRCGHPRPAQRGVAPNLNVIALKTAIPLNPATEKQMVKESKDKLATMGITVAEIKSAEFHVDGHKALSMAYERDDPATKKTLRQWTVIFPGKNGACIMTCTALKSQWAEAGQAFKSIINSLKFDGVPAN